MYIKSITAENWRNLEAFSINPCKKINVICGENAQGKTNLLECIYMFCGAKSFRGAKDSELIQFKKEFSKAEIEFFSHEREQEAKITVEQHRKATLNGVELKSAATLSEQVHVIVFSPDSLSVIKQGPKERRRFLNTGISSVYLNYTEHYKSYNRLLIQRNSLLKNLKYNNGAEVLLDEYDRLLSKFGAHMILTRRRYIKRITEYLPEIFCELTNNRETVDIEYVLNGVESETEDGILNALRENRKNDIMTGSTSVGPHRDDISFLINGKSAKNYGSQGQQRSIIIAEKLAEAKLLKEICGEEPIALLDDVMSELDEKRQDYILNHIDKWQVFITCCDNSSAEKLAAGKIFAVSGGRITDITK